MTNDPEMNQTTPLDEIHDLVGAYVLGALDDDEAAEFERHLSRCATCPEEIEQMQPALVGLESLLEDSAPPGLAASIASHASAEEAAAEHDVDRPVVLPKTPRWARRASQLAIAAGVAIIALVVWDGSRDEGQDRIAEIASAQDARVFTLSGDLADVDLVVSDTLDAVAFADERFEERDSAEFYALWIVEANGVPQFLGRVRPGSDGLVRQAWESPPDDAVQFAVSVESGEVNPEVPSDQVVLSGDTSQPAN